MNFGSWDDMAVAIIRILQVLITAGIGLRCIVIIQNGREDEIPWPQILKQVKGHVGIVILSLVVTEMMRVIAAYFGGTSPI